MDIKRTIVSAMVALCAITASAQNIQVHYDFGRHINSDNIHGRQDVTLTYEAFKADKLGSWYYFIDVDANKNGVTGAYTELSREFSFAKATENSSFAGHVEFDGGMSKDAGTFQSALLVGPAWNGHSSDWSKTYSVQLLYKQFFGQSGEHQSNHGYASFQVTGVWGINFANNKCTFSGFIDFWRGINASNGHGSLVILTEPQFWYNVTPKFSVGTEWEMSNNFIYLTRSPYTNEKFYFNPTLAVKFNL